MGGQAEKVLAELLEDLHPQRLVEHLRKLLVWEFELTQSRLRQQQVE